MSAYKFSFEKLEVWQLSRVLVIDIYKLMEQFPEKEKYGLVSQMKERQFRFHQILQKVPQEILPKTKLDFQRLLTEV